MSKAFKKLVTELELTDTLMFGKLKGCRICDVIGDEYEYLMWLHSNKMAAFSQEVVAKLSSIVSARDAEVYYNNEIAPYLDDDFDDIPF